MFFLIGVDKMSRVNKLKVFIVASLIMGMVFGVYFLVNSLVFNESDNIVIKKIKSSERAGEPIYIEDELLTLVNYDNLVPQDWQVDLVKLNNGHSVDRRMYEALQLMLNDARSEGLKPLICSSYRSNEKQTQLYQSKVKEYLRQGYSQSEAEDKAAFWVARPGTSEHQLGLAVDIVSTSNQRLDKSQENTAEQKWLMENCYKYGFILRYPTSKSSITGVGYEPWHYRYVGKTHSKKIYELGICLEEYVK